MKSLICRQPRLLRRIALPSAFGLCPPALGTRSRSLRRLGFLLAAFVVFPVVMLGATANSAKESAVFQSAVHDTSRVLAILVILGAGLSIPLTIIFLRYRVQLERLRLWHQQRLAAIDKGIELPPAPIELLDRPSPAPVRSPTTLTLLVGLALAAAGIGLRFPLPPPPVVSVSSGNEKMVVAMMVDRHAFFQQIGGALVLVGAVLVIYFLVARWKRVQRRDDGAN